MGAIDVDETARRRKRRGNEALLGQTANESSLTTVNDEPLGFSCECGRVGCSETVWMVGSHFQQVARSESVYLVAPGHCADDEHVIASTGGYLLVGPETHAPSPNNLHPTAA